MSNSFEYKEPDHTTLNYNYEYKEPENDTMNYNFEYKEPDHNTENKGNEELVKPYLDRFFLEVVREKNDVLSLNEFHKLDEKTAREEYIKRFNKAQLDPRVQLLGHPNLTKADYNMMRNNPAMKAADEYVKSIMVAVPLFLYGFIKASRNTVKIPLLKSPNLIYACTFGAVSLTVSKFKQARAEHAMHSIGLYEKYSIKS